MLKWAMRIVAVGGALLALAVGTAAWMHRTEGRQWEIATPSIFAGIVISPQYVGVVQWRRGDWDRPDWNIGQYGVASHPWDNSFTKYYFSCDMAHAGSAEEYHGFGIIRGVFPPAPVIPSWSEIICPTWSLIMVLLLPMGLWAGIGWRQRRRVMAGHCANCGYDLRATPEKCPECGGAVERNAE